MPAVASRRALEAAVAGGLALVLALGAGACGADSGPTGAPGATGDGRAAAAGLAPYDPAQELPPSDVTAIRALYDPALARLGLRLTRAELIDLSKGGYEPSPTGTHLALYAEPTGAYSTEQYITGFWGLAKLITPDVFARWSSLESYDICQEPLPAEDDDPSPFPVTQLNIPRDAAEAIDWDNGSLVDLIAAGRQNRDVKVVVSSAVRASPTYEALKAEAEKRAPVTDSQSGN